MAATEITVQEIVRSGLEFTTEPANADGNFFANDGDTFLYFLGSTPSGYAVTINSTVDCDQDFDHDPTVVIAANTKTLIGPFPISRFSDNNGRVNISYSGVASLNVAAINLPSQFK